MKSAHYKPHNFHRPTTTAHLPTATIHYTAGTFQYTRTNFHPPRVNRNQQPPEHRQHHPRRSLSLSLHSADATRNPNVPPLTNVARLRSPARPSSRSRSSAGRDSRRRAEAKRRSTGWPTPRRVAASRCVAPLSRDCPSTGKSTRPAEYGRSVARCAVGDKTQGRHPCHDTVLLRRPKGRCPLDSRTGIRPRRERPGAFGSVSPSLPSRPPLSPPSDVRTCGRFVSGGERGGNPPEPA